MSCKISRNLAARWSTCEGFACLQKLCLLTTLSTTITTSNWERLQAYVVSGEDAQAIRRAYVGPRAACGASMLTSFAPPPIICSSLLEEPHVARVRAGPRSGATEVVYRMGARGFAALSVEDKDWSWADGTRKVLTGVTSSRSLKHLVRISTVHSSPSLWSDVIFVHMCLQSLPDEQFSSNAPQHFLFACTPRHTKDLGYRTTTDKGRTLIHK